MKKIFVLDTNVLLHNPNSIFSFEDNIVVIPDIVLEELDKFKNGTQEINVNARKVSKILEKLRLENKLTDGVTINQDGTLKIETHKGNIDEFDNKVNDNKILSVCKYLKKENNNVILVTKDINLRIKADILDIKTEDFEFEQAPVVSQQYKGRRTIYVLNKDIVDFFNSGKLDVNELDIYNKKGDIISTDFISNEFIVLKDITGQNGSALGRILKENKSVYIVKLDYADSHPYEINARNTAQRFMLEALMSPVDTAPLVIIKGPAGTAKTFMSLAVGLQKTMEDREFRRILVCRPNITMDEDLGFLPGTEKEKIAPLMRPIYDNLEVSVDSDQKSKYDNERELNEKVSFIFEKGYIDMQAVGYLRGRSISKHFIIIDEAQNLTPNQITGVITRAGKDTKIVICGDPLQIDSPYLDERTNGLSYASEFMKDSPLCWQITADEEECVRSALAMEAIKRIKKYK